MDYLISLAICHGQYRSVHCHKVDRQARTMTKQKGCCTAIQQPFLVRLTGFEPAAFRVGELGHPAIYNDPARKFVRRAQIPALFVVAIKECWNAKSDNQHRLKRKVVKWWSTCGFRSLGVGRHYLCRAKFRHAWVSRHRAMATEARSAAARAAARPGRPSSACSR